MKRIMLVLFVLAALLGTPPSAHAATLRVVTLEMFNTPVPNGQFPGPYAAKWRAYNGTTPNGERTYSASAVSVHTGMLHMWGSSTGIRSGIMPVKQAYRYGKVEWSMRINAYSGGLAGYAAVGMLWSNRNNPGDGEIDYPEGSLTGQPHIYVHNTAPKDTHVSCFQQAVGPRWPLNEWHAYGIDVQASGITLYYDYQPIATTGCGIPLAAMNWALEFGPAVGVKAIPAGVTGEVLIDWVQISEYS